MDGRVRGGPHATQQFGQVRREPVHETETKGLLGRERQRLGLEHAIFEDRDPPRLETEESVLRQQLGARDFVGSAVANLVHFEIGIDHRFGQERCFRTVVFSDRTHLRPDGRNPLAVDLVADEPAHAAGEDGCASPDRGSRRHVDLFTGQGDHGPGTEALPADEGEGLHARLPELA